MPTEVLYHGIPLFTLQQTNVTMENHHVLWHGYIRYKWRCSIAMSVITRAYRYLRRDCPWDMGIQAAGFYVIISPYKFNAPQLRLLVYQPNPSVHEVMSTLAIINQQEIP